MGKLGYDSVSLSNKDASTRIIWKGRRGDMREAYSKLFKTNKHGDKNSSYCHRAHFKDNCLSRVETRKFPDISGTGVNNLFKDQPAIWALIKFLNLATSPSNDFSCNSIARLDATATDMLDVL